MSTVLHLARHGETDDNANKVFQGQRGAGLNARGRAQAERLAARVAPSIDTIVSSDLQRARETAAIVAAAVKTEVVLDEGLREVDVGAWTGLSYEEVAAKFLKSGSKLHRARNFPRRTAHNTAFRKLSPASAPLLGLFSWGRTRNLAQYARTGRKRSQGRHRHRQDKAADHTLRRARRKPRPRRRAHTRQTR